MDHETPSLEIIRLGDDLINLSHAMFPRRDAENTKGARREEALKYRLERMKDESDKILELVGAIMLPPVGVCLKDGCCSWHLILNILLFLCGYVPGLCHALWYVLRDV